MTKSSEPASPKKYSLDWARGIVQELADCYPRALNLVIALYGITLEDLARYLSRGDPVFNYVKRRTQYLANQCRNQEKGPAAIQALSKEEDFIVKFAPESARGRLDSRLKMLEARRAGSEDEVPVRSSAKGRNLPSVLYQFVLFPDLEGSDREVFEVRSV